MMSESAMWRDFKEELLRDRDDSVCQFGEAKPKPPSLRKVPSYLWARLAWSRALFGLLILDLTWTASLFIAPMILKPGTFARPYTQYPVVAYRLGGANQLDYEPIWQTLWFYPRAVYTFGDIQCHELWYRFLWISGNQMPIDARMTSMYIFANFGLVAAALAAPSTSGAAYAERLARIPSQTTLGEVLDLSSD